MSLLVPEGGTAVASFCAECGTSLPRGARFCTECGHGVGSLPRQAALPSPFSEVCGVCGGDGSALASAVVVCPSCRWLRPIGGHGSPPVDSYLWELDAAAMTRLRSIAPLNAAAHELSSKFGRPFFEAAVNGIRLAPDQMGEIHEVAVRAARTIGLPRMPSVYVSGGQIWDVYTLGDGMEAFVVLGSVLVNASEEDLLYVLGREMGHIATGHALWRTVLRFVTGQAGPKGPAGMGIVGLLNPMRLIESAVEAPLMAWARHSEITADRAGLLVSGDVETAHRIAMQWTLKSIPVARRVNMEAFDRQIAESGPASQIVEATTSVQPYLARRIQLQREFAATGHFAAWRAAIEHARLVEEAERPALRATPVPAAPSPSKPPEAPQDKIVLSCPACGTRMKVARETVSGGTANVRCPNRGCAKILSVRPPPGLRTETDPMSD